MNPGLVVKLRPTGPWRIGPDSGARNRVDFIYHSDSLYSAVTSAMGRLGSLDDWLSATARASAPEVCFSSCFPFLDEIGFIVPPRTIWPPASPALMASRTRWKSARFVPLGIVQAILAGQTLADSHWTVDGPSQCLVPAGRHGPFRTDTRWSAAIDRLTGSSERHSTTCIEFRPGAGLWTIVSFRDEAARDRWLAPVKAAFRLLADSGFGGERSRGWGRSEAPEFIEGELPGLILPPAEAVSPAPEPASVPKVQEERAEAAPEPPSATPEPSAEAGVLAAPDVAPLTAEPELPAEPAATGILGDAAEEAPAVPVADEPAPSSAPPTVEAAIAEAPAELPAEALAELPAESPTTDAPSEPAPSTEAPAAESAIATPQAEPESAPPPAEPGVFHHWLLSLFAPAPGDAIDWTRGNYALLTRGGRVESPAGSGDAKKLLQMIAEGSVLYGAAAPTGSAPDVAPDGFPHPVFRAGFAVAIPLPGGRS